MLNLGRLPKLSNRKLTTIRIDDFKGGVNTLFSDTRLKKNEAKEALNLMLIEDGIWDKRWGTKNYGGVTFTNTIDGFSEYRKSDGTRELIVVADGKVWNVDPDAGTKTEISGATFTQGVRCYFIQAQSYLYIANGVDVLARYDGSTLVTYTQVNTPTTFAISRNTLTAGDFTYYYRVAAANAVGTTVACTEVSITVNKDRDLWGTNESLALSWDAMAGATKYIIYFSDTSGYEVKLADSVDNSYTDTGTAVPNTYIEPQEDNTTSGPRFGPMCVSGNRILGTGDPNNPYRVYFSGTGVNLGNFSPAYDGGWVELETGGRNIAIDVKDYQGKAHVICKTDEGRGSIWQVTFESQTIDTVSFVVPIPLKIIASVGSPAPRSIIYVENDIFMMNPRGVYVLGNEPGVLNVLRTNELSARIRPYIRSLAEGSLNKVSAYYYDAKVFFSVPNATGEPNRTLVYDRERLAWYKDWSIGVSQYGEFTDSSGTTHLLGISGNKLVKFSEQYTDDNGTAFTWRYTSPRFPVSDDWTQFAKIKRVYVKLRNATGNISFQSAGTTKTSQSLSLGSSTISSQPSNSGIGWDRMGTVRMGTTGGTPTHFQSESTIKYINVNKLVRDLQFQVSGTGSGDRAVITGLQADGFLIPTSKPSDWKLTVS